MRKYLFIFFLLFASLVQADTVTLPTTYQNGGTVTATNLNNNFTSITTQVNGGLDNNNANTAGGYRFFETRSSLPSNGSQGRTVFNTSNNTLNFDNGTAWITAVATSTPSTGYIPYYNSGWTLLTPGTQYYPLVSNGTTSLPTYQQLGLTTGVTGTLPVANGGTNATTVAGAITSLFGSTNQGDLLYDNGTSIIRLTPGTSGQFLKTNGAAANPEWASVGMTFVSATAMSTTNSGDITISPSKIYRIVIEGTANSGGGGDERIRILFNSDATGYYNVSDTGITDGVMLHLNAETISDGVVFVDVIVSTVKRNTDSAFVNGASIYYNAAYKTYNIKSIYTDDTTISSFEVITTNDGFTGNIYVYEMRLN